MPNPLASARQLWRLNKEGRLLLVGVSDGGRLDPVSEVAADEAIKEGLALPRDGSRPEDWVARTEHA